MVPSGLSGRASPSAIKLSNSSPIRQQQQRHQAPGMVLSGLPSPPARKKKITISDPMTTPPAKKKTRSSSTWNDDFGTTVGRAAFASLKDKARDMMVKGAEKRGLDWTGIVEGLKVRMRWNPIGGRLPSVGLCRLDVMDRDAGKSNFTEKALQLPLVPPPALLVAAPSERVP